VSSDVPTPGLAGAYDGWVVAAARDGTVRWSLAFGGVRDDVLTRIAVAPATPGSSRLLIGGSVASDTTVGLLSEPVVRFSTDAEALLVEVRSFSGEVLAALRTDESYVAEIVPSASGGFVAATQHVVRTFE